MRGLLCANAFNVYSLSCVRARRRYADSREKRDRLSDMTITHKIRTRLVEKERDGKRPVSVSINRSVYHSFMAERNSEQSMLAWDSFGVFVWNGLRIKTHSPKRTNEEFRINCKRRPRRRIMTNYEGLEKVNFC